MRKVARHLIPILAAVLVGPLIAGFAVSLYAMRDDIFDSTHTFSFADEFGSSVAYILFAYIFGGPIALLAGVLVSIGMIWRKPNALLAIGSAVIATCVYTGIATLVDLPRVDIWFMLIFAVIAASGCWLLSLPFLKTRLMKSEI